MSHDQGVIPDEQEPSLGHQRSWYWRGWRIRYSFLVAARATDRPPILLLHGFGASLGQWRRTLAPLAQQHPVYALDLLGFGGSAKAATTFGTDLWVEQVHDFWCHWLGEPVVLMGHSLGALVALTAAITYPEMCDRIVLLTLPAARQELLPGWLEAIARPLERTFSTPLLIRPLFGVVRQPWLLRAVLRNLYSRPERVDAALVDSFARPPRERGAARTLCYLVRSRTNTHFSPATRPLVQQLYHPTLLLWGQADQVIPPQWGRQVTCLNDHVTLVELPNAGHFLYDEYPDQVNQAILDWLGTDFSREVSASPH
ncbi:Alpha/beta hydrolase [Halomicronema hongdechloris C2206]|uniref:Alpha/beta hydrolase n=1 Tax=Halomicronema hongdechloris C2206 TaxID=1641165 RepID=A0A1Z3HQI2_9CYAN|nr:alpha/beta fold hydrolase [Halomicronema hongdechloris]ASC72571.1 Alpha/beta hydrolase [Halomicronema hongdechloris C2206]